MKHYLLVSIFILGFAHHQVVAQTGFYDADTVREVRLYFNEANWDEILDSLYVEGENNRLLASVMIDGQWYDSVGVRYKGFSSFSTSRTKNPFNIKLDYVINQDHEGYEKLKLGNVIQDPSFLREILSYEIARKYMPAPEANFANVYVNDTLWGLYANIESVENAFLTRHFGSRDHCFVKANPEHLDLNGENSNLGNSPGTDSTSYYELYKMKSDYGWEELYHLIDTLNNHPDSIENILNVDRALWMHAFNYTLVNFDSYVGYAQNYYLYRQANGQFNPILWDLNMSFASYRLADASEHWDGFSILEAQEMDPLLHYHSVSVYERPLMRNLFENDTYRRMYLAHMRTMLEENFANQWYYGRGQTLQGNIAPHVYADTNKFYSDADFDVNLDATVSDLVDYPGIAELMDARVSFLSTYTGFSGAPDYANLSSTPHSFTAGDDLTFTAEVTNANNVLFFYRFGADERFQSYAMVDDGTQGDATAGDGTYTCVLPSAPNYMEYYFYAENDSAGRFSPERAAYEFYTLEAPLAFNELVINEFMASNNSTVWDEDQDYDDWIELYNPGTVALSTGGMFLSDNPNDLEQWSIPATLIAPDSYLIIWADENTWEGAMHANFQLNASGDTLYLSNAQGTIIDSVIFGAQTPDRSTGRFPNGTGDFQDMPATFAAANDTTETIELDLPSFWVYPNPSNGRFTVAVEYPNDYQLTVYSIEGKQVAEARLTSEATAVEVTTQNWLQGLYFVTLSRDDFIATKKILIIQ